MFSARSGGSPRSTVRPAANATERRTAAATARTTGRRRTQARMEIPSTAAAKIEAAVRTAGGLPSKKAAKGSQKDWSGGSVRTGAGARSNCVLERKNDNGRKYRTGSRARKSSQTRPGRSARASARARQGTNTGTTGKKYLPLRQVPLTATGVQQQQYRTPAAVTSDIPARRPSAPPRNTAQTAAAMPANTAGKTAATPRRSANIASMASGSRPAIRE